MDTLKVDNFGGRLTRYQNGDINSGYAKYSTTFGADPFGSPGLLTWQEQAVQIDSAGSVITDMIVAGKERVESGVSYVYAVGHTGRLYKIQVNDPSTYNPNYDNPVLVATLASNSPTFKRGGSMEFYGATEQIFIGHDTGVTRINFDGSAETFVGLLGSWTQAVPRPVKQFNGSLYYGNGSNIAEINSALIVNSYGKLSPAFPNNTQVRDIDLSTDGNYLQMVVSRLALPDITVGQVDTSYLSNSESYIFWWNGSDLGYTSIQAYPSFSLNSNQTFGDKQTVFGYDLAGAVLYDGSKKLLSPVLTQAPLPNAIGPNGNLIGWMTPEFVSGFLRASLFVFGSLDREVAEGWWRQYQQAAQGSETDVLVVPFQMLVSNLVIGSVVSGYSGGLIGTGKLYFSTLETSPAPTTKYKFYRLNNVPLGTGTSIAGVYETQTQIMSKKVSVQEVRIYTKPIVAGNSFTVDLIGSGGTPISGSSKTFTAGSNMNVGDDRMWYDPAMAPTYAIGLRVTNAGTTNMSVMKVEIDHSKGGE